MRWFKHLTDSHRDISIQYLLDEMGHSGLCYFILVEMCAEKLDRPKNSKEKLTKDDCEFVFSRKVVGSALRLRPAAVERLLNCCQTSNLFTYELDSKYIKIKMPILLDILDSDFKKTRHRRVTDVSPTRPEEDKDKDKDKEKNNNTFNSKSIICSDRQNLPSEPAPSKPLSKVFKFKIKESFSVDLSDQLVKSWAETYPKEFVEQEMSKARNWLIANEHKWPRKHWQNFFNAWLARSWDKYRVSLKSNPPMVSFDQLKDILEG